MPRKEGVYEHSLCKENKSKKVTHIIGGNHGFMGFKRNVGFFGLLRAFEASGRRNLLDRSPGDPRRNFMLSRLISNYRRSRRSSRSIFWRFLVITTTRNKLCITRKKEGKCGAIAELEETFTMPGGRNIQYLLREQGLY
jgi:hypothetical protein